MKRTWILTSALCGVMSVLCPPPATGQDATTQPAGPVPIEGLGFSEAHTPGEILGPQFTSQAAGISLRPPANSKTIRRVGGETVVEFVQEEKKISLRVSRTVLAKPMKLVVPNTNPDDPNRERGMAELSREQLLTRLPVHKKLREDVIPLAGHDAGVLVLRGSIGPQDQLVQQAVIQASEQLYYTILMSSPGQPVNADPKPNPQEAEAAALFRSILDSVTVLDQEKLRAEQDERLLRTRSLFLNWNEARLRSVLVPEQWMRVIKDGKDVGYSFIVEEPEQRGVNPGLKIGIRSRMMLPAASPKLKPTQLDAETWWHTGFDRRTESWTSQSFFQEHKPSQGDPNHIEKYLITEHGTTAQQRKPVPDKNALGGGVDPRNPGIRLIDTYTISVHRKSKNVNAAPIDRDLPPYYVPQAIGHLLPRLVPLEKPTGYLFASWVTSEAEVKLRYVDIGEKKQITIGGEKRMVIPVTDRIGFDGAPTTHYMAMDGKYLGSESVSTDNAGGRTVLTILPTDAATLQGLWKNANLTAPSEKAPDAGNGGK